MNENNVLNLKCGTWIRIVRTWQKDLVVAIPTVKSIGNARVLSVNEGGSFTAHWEGNFNKDGDFNSELMSFDNNLVEDNKDVEERNRIRRENGLVEIS